MLANDIERKLHSQKQYFFTGATKPYAFRLSQLKRLKQVIKKYEAELLDTLEAELRKPGQESYLTEIGVTYEEINFTIKHLKRWMKPRKVTTPLTHIGSSGVIYPEPYGVSLIIAPWNYPVQLALAPLIGAIAAGNCAMLKPSELTPRTSALLKKMMDETFDENYVAVVEGGVEVSTELLKQRFDAIFFTGSVPVGKIVMEAAAKHLTPVTLELGGKSPSIVGPTANLELTAKRIVWGKFSNAGQTCIAPDYLLAHHSVKQKLLERMEHYIVELYGANPRVSGHYGSIVTERHARRLADFIDKAHIVRGGKYDTADRYIEPTIIDQVTLEDQVMQEEIFGPVLPVFEYKELDEAIQFIRSFEKPLALYLFSTDSAEIDTMLQQISFGGGCINDTLTHIATPYLPFGGVGQSGVGAYHGKASFDVFTHHKSVLHQTVAFDLPARYANSRLGAKLVRALLK
ncbi:aldehyde dehydrogenase [Paenibacillus rigui]|uniref:Aldehyde dehydrogenase n=1 Tax=Paenibacillus rigui TaxID=554312 RepID=A0A229UQU8_9BACL|nr:aldehyde dehydrogenase [Paenibacillus rigui]OXM85770.1 aldehyde dehydrogenase family protein [Paenibacillus rigui]